MFNIWIAHGIFYGFSDESIIHFIRRRLDPDYGSIQLTNDRKLMGTGLVIAPEEEHLEEADILAGIAERRIVPDPFPEGKCGRYTLEQNLEFMNHPTFLPRYKNILSIVQTKYNLLTHKGK